MPGEDSAAAVAAPPVGDVEEIIAELESKKAAALAT
jgi:hypothetical protein